MIVSAISVQSVIISLFLSLNALPDITSKGLPGKDGLDGLPGNDGTTVSVTFSFYFCCFFFLFTVKKKTYSSTSRL